MTDRVKAGSLVTLHYRIAGGDDEEFASTFGATPATLQLGSGELAPPLESCVIGLAIGERQVFVLEPEQAFGPRNPQLVFRLARSELPEDKPVEVDSLMEMPAPGGGSFAGWVREADEESVLVDFNHPLAGRTVRFEVEVVAVL
jgi:FKBP-type peptidyl-prolyl cis-trans isomerase SlpA